MLHEIFVKKILQILTYLRWGLTREKEKKQTGASVYDVSLPTFVTFRSKPVFRWVPVRSVLRGRYRTQRSGKQWTATCGWRCAHDLCWGLAASASSGCKHCRRRRRRCSARSRPAEKDSRLLRDRWCCWWPGAFHRGLHDLSGDKPVLCWYFRTDFMSTLNFKDELNTWRLQLCRW